MRKDSPPTNNQGYFLKKRAINDKVFEQSINLGILYNLLD